MTQEIKDVNFTNTRTAIIDADSLSWIIGYVHKDHDDVEAVIKHTDEFVHSILQAVQCRLYIGVLGSDQEGDTFRVSIFPEYKAKRPEKPEWYQKWGKVVNARLRDKWGFICCPTAVEADDLVLALHSFIAAIPGSNPIICENDKDLQQVEGHFYNFRRNVGYYVTKEEAATNLWTQVITGDSTDNIPGIPGKGPVAAKEILGEATPEEMPHAVLHAYIKKFGEYRGIEEFYKNYMLVKMQIHQFFPSTLPVNSYDLDKYAVRIEEVTEGSIESTEGSDLFTIE